MSISERGTCPTTCGMYDAGCYAEYGKLGAHWKRVSDSGISWEEFLDRVRALPEGQLWRHNEAGDIDVATLGDLVKANAGRRGFTFTHRTDDVSLAAIAVANLRGFTINLSADSLEEADRLAATAAGPVVVVLPHDAPRTMRTPQGRHVVACVAQTVEGMTCADCRLCQVAGRHSIVGFRAHGQYAKRIPELIQLRRRAGVEQ